MSHFTVMTILRKGSNKTLEDILAPYDENLEVAPYVRRTKAELIQEMRERAANIVSDLAILASVKDEREYRDRDTHYGYSYVRSDVAKAIAALVDAPDEKLFEAVKGECGESLNENGDYISTYNPNSKWDWYAIGGRWGGELILKNGHRDDEAEARFIDWDAMETPSKEAKEHQEAFWDAYVLGKLPEDVPPEEATDYIREEFGFTIYRPEYFLETYGTKENYVRRMAIWSTYAVVDDKGWHAPGEMGWFGCSSETAESKADWEENFRARFIDTLDPEDTVVIVDCHI